MSSFGVPRTLQMNRLFTNTISTMLAIHPLNPPENPEDFVDLGITREQRLTHSHLSEDTAYGPHVDCGAVVSRTQKDFRCSVPESDDLVVKCVGKSVRCDQTDSND
jgi:hypothetical protein